MGASIVRAAPMQRLDDTIWAEIARSCASRRRPSLAICTLVEDAVAQRAWKRTPKRKVEKWCRNAFAPFKWAAICIDMSSKGVT